MKLSELRPCDVCKGPIAPIWQMVTITMAGLNRNATNGVFGLTQYFGNTGGALAIAEAMAPAADDAVMVMGEKDKSLVATLFICQQCYLVKNINLAELAEMEHRRGSRD